MSEHDELLQVFHEEADDLLGELEAALLLLESGSRDDGLLAQAFRSLHTLKGTCSMYGFNEAAGLAHEVETLFVRALDGDIDLTSELLDLALQARDSMAALVSGSENDAAVARRTTQRLMDAMQEFAAGRPSTRGSSDHRPHSDAADGVRNEAQTFKVLIHPRGDLFKRGVSLTGLVGELASLGAATVDLDTANVPSLEELDPEECYLSVGIELVTEAGRRAIEESLMFLDDGEFVIEADSAPEGRAETAGPGRTTSFGTGQGRSVRVSAERLDELVDLVGELVTTQVALRDAVADTGSQRVLDVSEQLESLVHALRESVLEMRMIPIGTTFGRFARYARDLAKELGKDVVLETGGGSSELDRGVIERIEEPLLHLIRNSIDHGVESPVERRLAGKPECGTIALKAFHSGGSMYIQLSDDGRGIDLDAVAARAKESGAIGSAEGLTDGDLVDLVFGAGFSTAGELTTVSGRGVGLDVVRKAVEGLQGAVDLDSRVGDGLTVTIRLPLTLAIIDGLLVQAGDSSYVLPLSGVEECLDFVQQPEWGEHQRDLVDVRGEVLPFVRLRDFFGSSGDRQDHEITAVVDVDGERCAVVVDRVIDRLQLVIKPLGRGLRRTEGLAGATVLGDGSVVFIVDMGQVRRLSGAHRHHGAGGADPVEIARGRP